MKKHPLLVAFSIIAFLLSGCNPDRGAKQNPVSFATFNQEKEVYLFNDTTAPKCELNFNIEYPDSAASPEQLKGIQRLFVNALFGDSYQELTPLEAIRKYEADYVADYRVLEQDYKKNTDGNNWMNYQQSFESEPTFNEGGFLCFGFYSYTYTGGAHGLAGKTYQVIDLKGPYQLTLADLFNETDLDRIAELIVSNLMVKQKYSDRAQLEETGYDLGAVVPTENFGMTDRGIVWQYNPYEIAAYALGMTDVTVPYADLLPFLKADSPIRPYAESHDQV